MLGGGGSSNSKARLQFSSPAASVPVIICVFSVGHPDATTQEREINPYEIIMLSDMYSDSIHAEEVEDAD